MTKMKKRRGRIHQTTLSLSLSEYVNKTISSIFFFFYASSFDQIKECVYNIALQNGPGTSFHINLFFSRNAPCPVENG